MRGAGDIWTWLDPRGERLFEAGLRVLGLARRLSRQTGAKNTALLVVGPEGGNCVAPEVAAERGLVHGADHVMIVDMGSGPSVRSDLVSAALARLVADRKPGLALFALSDLGREIASRAARLADAGLISDCMDIRVEDGGFMALCPAWSGEILAEICFRDHEKTGFATVRPYGFPLDNFPRGDGKVERLGLSVPGCPGLRLLSSLEAPPNASRLEDAKIVVVGGAGLGNVEGFGLARELASALGGEVGATRPAVLQHWASEQRLIGQTGRSVRPSLLIAAGVSGAVQFTAGIEGSGSVVAINRDPNASIFEKADLGIVADARSLLPLLIDKTKKSAMRRLADLLKGECGDGGFGSRARSLRESHGMSVEELAGATSQTPEFIEQMERDQVQPSVAFLLRLSRALGVDPDTFLTDREKGEMRDRRKDEYKKRTDNYSYQTLTPGGEQSRLRGFMITIEPKQAHKPVAYKHEGEEFIFVMEGELELTLDGKPHQLKPGEHIHFNSETPHKLKSLSDQNTRCLVMLYTP